MPNAIPSAASPAIDGAALDRLLTSGALSIPDLTTRRAEFKLYTAAATTSGGDDDTNPDTGNPRVHAIGSSTIRDLQGDTMELSALQDMQKAPPGLAIFVNHCYDVPEDLVGRLFDYPTAVSKRGIADLLLDIEILQNVNPRAKQLYAGIQAGVRQGVSIGCMITAAQWVDQDGNVVPDDEIDFWDIWEGRVHLHILGVDPLEWSFVGIPANQRSWVQYAAQGLFRRALRMGDAAAASRLTPLVRGWFPTDFQHDLLDLAGADAALRKTVSEVGPRKVGKDKGRQLLWLPDSATFGLRNPQTKRTQEVSRERVAALLAGEDDTMTTRATSAPQSAPQSAPAPDITAAAPAAPAAPATKDATGKRDWPLGERDAAWDSGAAHKRIVAWAGGASEVDSAKMQSVHFWSPEGDDAQSVSKYKLLFCDQVDGAIKAMPRAIMACWGAHGVDAADIPTGDKDAVKKKISAYAARMRDEFNDPDIMPPWDKESEDSDKGAEPDTTKSEAKGEGTDNSMPDAKDMTVAADGTHAACKGSHAHGHAAMGSQGGDATHEHEHSHDGDANHDHHGGAADATESAGADKSADVDAQAAAPTPSGESLDSTPAPTTNADPARVAALSLAQTLARTYGFTVSDGPSTTAAAAPTAPDARKCMLVDNDADAQRVITYMSNLDMYLDQAEQCSDEIMALLRIPDVDEDDGGATAGDSGDGGNADNSDVAGPRYPVTESASAPKRRLLTRAGARHSAADTAAIQAIHDAAYALTNGECCKGMANDADANTTPEGQGDAPDGADTAGGNGGGQSTTDLEEAQALLGHGAASMSAMPRLLASLGDLTALLKNFGLPALDLKVRDLGAAVDAAKAEQDTITAEQERVVGEIARLRGTPLGRPTAASLQRGVATANADATIPAVTADSLTPEGQAREAARAAAAAKAQTTTQYVAGVGMCRLWPDGASKDMRPALSPLQRMALESGFTDIRRAMPAAANESPVASPEALVAAYTSGGGALIPIVMDGE